MYAEENDKKIGNSLLGRNSVGGFGGAGWGEGGGGGRKGRRQARGARLAATAASFYCLLLIIEVILYCASFFSGGSQST